MGSMKKSMLDLAVEKIMLKNLGEPANASINKKIKECRVALITSAGVHLKTQTPFDGENGDSSYREIPGDSDISDLTITHGHYDQSEAEKDINVVLPVERLRELSDKGVIGSVAKSHFGFMGFAPDSKELMEKYAPEVAEKLVQDNVDIAIFSPA